MIDYTYGVSLTLTRWENLFIELLALSHLLEITWLLDLGVLSKGFPHIVDIIRERESSQVSWYSISLLVT